MKPNDIIELFSFEKDYYRTTVEDFFRRYNINLVNYNQEIKLKDKQYISSGIDTKTAIKSIYKTMADSYQFFIEDFLILEVAENQLVYTSNGVKPIHEAKDIYDAKLNKYYEIKKSMYIGYKEHYNIKVGKPYAFMNNKGLLFNTGK